MKKIKKSTSLTLQQTGDLPSIAAASPQQFTPIQPPPSQESLPSNSKTWESFQSSPETQCTSLNTYSTVWAASWFRTCLCSEFPPAIPFEVGQSCSTSTGTKRMAETGNGLRFANPTDLNNYWSFLAFTTWKPSSFQTCNAQDSQSLLSPSPVINPSAFIWNCPSQTQSDLALKWVLIPDISQTIPNSEHPSGMSKPWNMETFSVRKALPLHISDQSNFSSLCQKENNLRIAILLFTAFPCYLLHEQQTD